MYVVFLAMVAAVPALATDMYLGAIPGIAQQWGCPESRVHLSLIFWFLSFCVFLLVWGPVSDKYGRRPVLVGGMTLFVGATFLCSFSQSVTELVLFRVFQGMAAAAPSAMCMAICRDKYEGHMRKKILAYISIILGLTPMIAPMIGALILKYSVWQNIFVAQGLFALITWAAITRFKETNLDKFQGSLPRAFLRYYNLVLNKRYMLCNNALGLIAGPFFGFLAFSSIVYISIYGLTEQTFGYLFGLNALSAMAGAFVCTRLTNRISDVKLLTICFVGCAAGGLGLLLFGRVHYLCFTLFMCLITFFAGMSRPMSTNIILEQVQADIGTASSFIVFYQFVVGAVCMSIVSRPWENPIRVFSLLTLIVPLIVLATWPMLLGMLRRSGQEF